MRQMSDINKRHHSREKEYSLLPPLRAHYFFLHQPLTWWAVTGGPSACILPPTQQAPLLCCCCGYVSYSQERLQSFQDDFIACLFMITHVGRRPDELRTKALADGSSKATITKSVSASDIWTILVPVVPWQPRCVYEL